MSRVYPYVAPDDAPAAGRPFYECPEGHRTRYDGLHVEVACRAEVRYRMCCNRRAVLIESEVSDGGS